MRKRKSLSPFTMHQFNDKTIDNRLACSRFLCGAKTKYRTADPKVSGSNPTHDTTLQTQLYMAIAVITL